MRDVFLTTEKYACIPEEIIEAICLCPLPGSAFRVLIFILTNRGFNGFQVAAACGLDDNTTAQAIDLLRRRNIIIPVEEGHEDINLDLDTWKYLKVGDNG